MMDKSLVLYSMVWIGRFHPWGEHMEFDPIDALYDC